MRRIEILLVDDHPADVALARRTLEDSGSFQGCRLHVAPDGLAALVFLRREGVHAAAPRPDLVLMDLNLPKLGGLELLREIRQDPVLTSLPVLILSTSDREQDILECYALHANAYLTKPSSLTQFRALMKGVAEFYLGVARLPGGARS